jgi:hypothetical protein
VPDHCRGFGTRLDPARDQRQREQHGGYERSGPHNVTTFAGGIASRAHANPPGRRCEAEPDGGRLTLGLPGAASQRVLSGRSRAWLEARSLDDE